jgi:hypothetical protein
MSSFSNGDKVKATEKFLPHKRNNSILFNKYIAKENAPAEPPLSADSNPGFFSKRLIQPLLISRVMLAVLRVLGQVAARSWNARRKKPSRNRWSFQTQSCSRDDDGWISAFKM